MGWYLIIADDGVTVVKRIYVQTLDDLAANTPEGCTVQPD